MRDPSRDEIAALHAAVLPNFPACTCHVLTGFGNYRVCAAHQWLTERDTRSTPIARWERLVFVRAVREHFKAQEFGPEPSKVAVDAKGVLPW